MIANNTIPAEQYSFKKFLFKNRRNRITLLLAAAAIVIQFAIFKYFYPFASYIHGDSFSYLRAADQNLTINTYLIGYSKFLRLFSVFAKPDYILVAFQYVSIQCSALFLIFTIFYFYKTGKIMQNVVLCFIIFNPLFLHLGNMISSDGFFLALSLTWFTLLLWIIHRPSKKIIIWHAFVLFIAFTVRYNALIYPFIAAIAFLLSKSSRIKKLAGIGLGLVLCGSFMGFTMYQYKKLTGYFQYSPFSGWQYANNSMYAYRYVDSASRKPVPKKFEALDKMIREYFDSTRDTRVHLIENIQASTFYMWSPGLPLMDYKERFFKKDTTISELKKWASMGPIYKSYGKHIILHYPWHFTRYFLWPNAKKYFAPPVEFLESYNSGRGNVTVEAKKWFGYKSTKVKIRMTNNIVWVLDFYPIFSGIVNLVMLCSLLFYVLLRGWQYNEHLKKGVILGGTIWLINASFTIFASPAALRFQSFPIILTTIFVALFVDWMVQLIGYLKQKEISSVHGKLENNLTSEAVA